MDDPTCFLFPLPDGALAAALTGEQVRERMVPEYVGLARRAVRGLVGNLVDAEDLGITLRSPVSPLGSK